MDKAEAIKIVKDLVKTVSCNLPRGYGAEVNVKDETIEALNFILSALQEKPFKEKYGLEINGKLIPLSELPSDINELNKLIDKPNDEVGVELEEILFKFGETYLQICGSTDDVDVIEKDNQRLVNQTIDALLTHFKISRRT